MLNAIRKCEFYFQDLCRLLPIVCKHVSDSTFRRDCFNFCQLRNMSHEKAENKFKTAYYEKFLFNGKASLGKKSYLLPYFYITHT
jgi:hypothetical protein